MEPAPLAVIRVVGVGGGGVNAVNRMIESNLRGVEFIAINTDAQDLLMSDADVKLEIGRESTRGLGAGADPEVGKAAASAHEEDIREALRDSNMVFVTAGEGGGTGTGAAPIVAGIARELGALTIGVVTRPFQFEGRRREQQADRGIEALREQVDALIVIPNQRLLESTDANLSVLEAFRAADQVLHSSVQGITEIITIPGTINVDFADVTTTLKDAKTALMGIGTATGPDRALSSVEMAISSPLLESSMDGADRVLIFFQGGTDLGMQEMNDAAQMVRELADPDANVIIGYAPNEEFADEIKVTVIAAGFEGKGGSVPSAHAAQKSSATRTTAARPAPAAPSAKPPASPRTSEP
ncbi:cell division protein FtsZ, partial [uncultured Mobiluncus sp.]